MFLINLFIIIVSFFFNLKSKNEYFKYVLFTAALLEKSIKVMENFLFLKINLLNWELLKE